MKNLMIFIIFLIFTSGCSSISYVKTLKDETAVEVRYVRWLNQSISSATVTLSDGTVLKFAGQKSDVEVALEYAGAKVGVK